MAMSYNVRWTSQLPSRLGAQSLEENSLRRLRAALLLTGLWALVWAAGGMVLIYLRLRGGGIEFDWVQRARDAVRVLLTFALMWGALGALNGLAFAAVLSWVGRRRTRGEKLTASRVALWGALASTLVAFAFLVLIAVLGRELVPVRETMIFLAVAAALGAVCSLGTFALAGGPSRVASHNVT